MLKKARLLLILLVIVAPYAASSETTALRADKILREVDDLWRGESSQGRLTLEVKTAHYTRKISMQAWSKGKEKSLVIILAPKKEKGTATLKSGSNIFSYLPKTDRTIRLTAGMMMGSWMGSHFTNDDLVKESRMSEDYDASITFEGKNDGVDIIEFTLTPKTEAAVVWGKIVMKVRSDNHMPVKSLYFDEDMAVARSMFFYDVKKMGGRLFPSVLKIVPSDKPEEYTKLTYHEMEFDIDLDDSFFSIAQLKRKRRK